LYHFVDDCQLEVVLHTAFERLARVSVFLEQARVGETTAINENVSFETELRVLEDDPETGLYWLLCAIHRAMYAAGSRPIVDRDVVAGVRRVRVPNVDRNALRHVRDYLVLRDFRRLLNRLSIEFAALRNYLQRRRTY